MCHEPNYVGQKWSSSWTRLSAFLYFSELSRTRLLSAGTKSFLEAQMNRIAQLLVLIAIITVTGGLLFWYSLSSGFCACPLVVSHGQNEAVLIESANFQSDTNVTLDIRNVGGYPVSFQIYQVKDSSGDIWQLNNWNPLGQPLTVNNLIVVNIAIGSGAGGCGNGCQYTGTPAAFTTFQSSKSYTITLTTSRNNSFVFTVTR